MADTYTDKNGYKRWTDSNRLVHRTIAYEHIYQPNAYKFWRNFSGYVIHHKDKNKLNNNVENLSILTKRQHRKLHGLPQPSFNWGWLGWILVIIISLITIIANSCS